MSTYSEYRLDDALALFFSQTSASREACDAKAKDIVGGHVIPVTVQGACSYSVYAGPEFRFVVQFRLDSLMLNSDVTTLARKIYGSLVPSVSLHGRLGEEGENPLFVYVLNRIQGISHLDFVLANGFPNNTDQNFAWRKTLMTDFAHFFAVTWKSPQEVDLDYRENLRRKYVRDLNLLIHSLPPRFQKFVQECLNSMNEILSLPMVLLHRDFGTCNIMVDEKSCHLAGVIDWAEAEICPFGQNLHSLQSFMGTLHLKNGWTRYDDYEALEVIFWSTFQDEVGGLSVEIVKTIKTARILGLLLSYGFTSRLANMPQATPIGDDETGRYNMLSLDGFLINTTTRFDNLSENI
ncbi:MAG: hypothetical protein M1825_002046 [Sarcosagium campestre]|nr:MAG: hypothetical protein M1825_002046 [Sarcosagium campestre]